MMNNIIEFSQLNQLFNFFYTYLIFQIDVSNRNLTSYPKFFGTHFWVCCPKKIGSNTSTVESNFTLDDFTFISLLSQLMTSIFCVTNATSFYFLSSNSFLAVWNCEFDRDPRFVVLIIFYINSSCIMLAFFKRIITSPALLIYLCVFRFTHFLHTLRCKLRIIHFLFVHL